MLMKRSPELNVLSAALAAMILITACVGPQVTGDKVLLCDSDQPWWDWPKEPRILDLDQQWIYGGDTGSSLYTFATDDFAGFEAEFPMLLFSDTVDPSQLQDDITVRDTVYRVSPVKGSDGDRWVITAEPREPTGMNGTPRYSRVLYCHKNGVLSIEAGTADRAYQAHYTRCGERKLRYEDLRALHGKAPAPRTYE
jgi:hypothetical protein